jgi:hypothetical protein
MATTTFGAETRSIHQHIDILAEQLGYENATQLAPDGYTTQPSPYEIVAYEPDEHDKLGSKEQILALVDQGDHEEMLMWLDAVRLCKLTSKNGIDLRVAYRDPKTDIRVVQLVQVLKKQLATPLFDSQVFRVRFGQPIFRPWLYLVSYFIEVVLVQQWQRNDSLFVIGVQVCGPVIPEWFVRVSNPLPVAIRHTESGVSIPVKQALCVYVRAERPQSFASTLLAWAYLTDCSRHKSIKHVLFPNTRQEEDKDNLPMVKAKYTGYDGPLMVISREVQEERFFPTHRLKEMMAKHERPGFRVDSHDTDYAVDGRPTVLQAPGPQPKRPARPSVPDALSPVPRSIRW